VKKVTDPIEREFKKAIREGNWSERTAAAAAYGDWLEEQDNDRKIEAAQMRVKAGVSEAYYEVVSKKDGSKMGRYKSVSAARGAITDTATQRYTDWSQGIYAWRTSVNKELYDEMEIQLVELRPMKIGVIPSVSEENRKKFGLDLDQEEKENASVNQD